jgi:hypothetical protein
MNLCLLGCTLFYGSVDYNIKIKVISNKSILQISACWFRVTESVLPLAFMPIMPGTESFGLALYNTQ